MHEGDDDRMWKNNKNFKFPYRFRRKRGGVEEKTNQNVQPIYETV